MASITKRRNKYCVVYRYIDENGVERQKWETFNTNTEAKKRKKEIEFKQASNAFIAPSCKTISELMYDYVTVYGVNKWAISTYSSNKSLIDNYIVPIIGTMKLDECTPRVMEKFYLDLLNVRAIARPNKKDCIEYVTPQTVHQVHKILRSAFNQAVKWEMIIRNPVMNATLPKVEKEVREIWDSNILTKALKLCDDDKLALCINLAFACSLRIGELLALTWDCVDISNESIEQGNAFVYIDKELQRVQRDGFDDLDAKDVKFKFPSIKPTGSTVLIIKSPKTKSSIRRVYLPNTVAQMLKEHKANQDEIKEYLGCEYYDYNLVIASSDGRPIEGQVINRGFSKLIKDNNLPKVVFHSLRHTSVTYKLKMNGGDIKAVQGDTGHSQINMVTDVYSHIVDEDRCKNAQKLQDTFYSNNSTEEPQNQLSDKSKLLIELLSKSPELADKLLQSIGQLK